jgi:hypothetical protein
MSEHREMTLDEYCSGLSETHLVNKDLRKLKQRIAELETDRDRLRAALKPFAKAHGSKHPYDEVTLHHLRMAAEALEAGDE